MMQQLILLLTMLSHNILFSFFYLCLEENCPGPTSIPRGPYFCNHDPSSRQNVCCLGEEQTHHRLLICSLHKGEYLIPQTVHSLLYIYHGVTAPSSRTLLLLTCNTWPSHLAVYSNINILTPQLIETQLCLVRNIVFLNYSS